MNLCVWRTRLVIVLASGVLGLGAGATASPRKSPPKAKLVLVIVVDQMRADYLDRFGDLFGKSGFGLFTRSGAVFSNCAYDYASTYTGPGHSTILSGIPVNSSGIIGNEWYDRALQRSMYCVEDTSTRSVGIDPLKAAGRMSPANFHGTTLGDQLTGASPSSRVIGVAIKDRGAILLAGKHPTGAFWFDPESGNWVSSSYYCRSLPGWAESFNAARYADPLLGLTWNRFLPDSCYERAGIDDAPGEGTLPGEMRPVFPHAIRDLALPGSAAAAGQFRRFDALLPTPYGDELTVKFTEAAIEGEQLGLRGVTDLLAVSFSSPDYCGHIFGPDSHEVEDIIVRLDRQLEKLFAYIDGRIGLQDVAVVLTSDHGVCPLPDLRATSGALRIDPKDFLMDIKVRLGQKLNYNEGNDNLILALSNNFIYLDAEKIPSHGFAPGAFTKAVMEGALKEKGIVRCYTRSDLSRLRREGRTPDSLGARIARTVNEERSGDIAVLLSEYSFFSGGTTGTTHGSPYGYDRHVPLLMFGPSIRPGRYGTPCRPNDVAPTLAGLLRIAPPPAGDGAALGVFQGNRGESALALPPAQK